MTITAFLQNTIAAGAIYTAPLVGLGGVFLAFRVLADLRRRDPGTAEMQELADEIRRGAFVFLRTEYQVLALFVGAVALLFFFAPGYGVASALAFALGAGASAVAGLIGMNAATLANVRTALAAKEGGEASALTVAFGGGAVMGLIVGGIGLLGAGVLFWIFGASDVSRLAPFAMGASSIALFARVGGGIFTKAADVGSDLVGKIEAGIPEDDPRNPGVIADNVGDNVGDVAGMGADLFESYVGALIAASILAGSLTEAQVAGLTAFVGEPLTFDRYRWALMGLPFVLAALGLFASLLGINVVQRGAAGEPRRALRRGTVFSVGVFLLLALIFFVFSNIRLVLFIAVAAGALGGIVIGAATEYFTSRGPVMRIVSASRTGAATNVIEGIAGGLESTALPLVGIATAIVIADWSGGLFGVGIAAVAMLATVSMTMSVDAYGPIADNAGGFAQLARLGPEVRHVTDKLDGLGNSTAAIGKGFAIGSAALTAIAFFAAYSQSAGNVVLDLRNPLVAAGLLVGAAVPALVGGMTIRSVSRAASLMVDEIRRQFRARPELFEGGNVGARPDSAPCIQIATRAALREMVAPGLLVVILPILVGFGLGPQALGGLLAGALVCGVLLALSMANSGGAWDNAKKLVESGAFWGSDTSPRQREELIRAVVIGDTVGDPLKDTAGPAMNILIKLLSIVSLIIAPALV